MAHETLKATIRQYIGPNGQNSITGQIMQDILIAMVDEYPNISGYATQSWVQQQGYITSSALSGYATQSWVQQQGYVTSSALDDYLPLSGGTLTGDLYLTNGKKINIILIEGRRIVDLNLGYSQISGTEYAWNMYIESALDVSAGLDMDGVFVGSGFKKIDGTSAQFLKADGSVDSNVYLPKQGNSFYFITDADMPEIAANISTLNAAHRMTLYRNAILMPYQMDNANDGGFIRSRGTSESSAIFEIGMWDDAGAGETIQFNYYPTTSTVNPTYSISVPKKTGTIALTSDLSGYATTSQLAGYLPLTGGTLTGDLYLTNGKKINIILIEGRRIVDLNLGYSQISGTEYAWNMYVESALDVSAGLDMDGVFVGSGFKKIDGTSSQFLKADGSVDGNSYLLSSGGTITGNLTVGGNNGINFGTDDDVYIKREYSRLLIINEAGNDIIIGDYDNRKFTSIVNDLQGGTTDSTYRSVTQKWLIRHDGDAYFKSVSQTSDLRKKTIMGDVPMNIYNVANAPLFKFTWKDEKKYSGQHVGSAAQYWQTVLPELVSVGRDADLTLAMQYDVIALASAITVAKTVVDHEARIRQLEEKIK